MDSVVPRPMHSKSRFPFQQFRGFRFNDLIFIMIGNIALVEAFITGQAIMVGDNIAGTLQLQSKTK